MPGGGTTDDTGGLVESFIDPADETRGWTTGKPASSLPDTLPVGVLRPPIIGGLFSLLPVDNTESVDFSDALFHTCRQLLTS